MIKAKDFKNRKDMLVHTNPDNIIAEKEKENIYEETKKEKRKLIIEAGNSGDMGVGIPPLEVKITIEANVDMQELLSDLQYQENDKMFADAIIKLLEWIDDMPWRIDRTYIE